MTVTLERTDSTLAGWSPSAIAAVDVLSGSGRGAIVTDDFGHTSQVTVLTDRGAVVLTSWTDDVPGAVRFVVGLTVDRLARSLGLPPITVRYFGPPVWVEDAEINVHDVDARHPAFDQPAPDDHQRFLGGVTSPAMPHTIALHVALEGDDLLRTIAHELRHAQQLWGGLDVPHEARERDAVAFAEQWMDQPR